MNSDVRDREALRHIAIAAGLGVSVLFVVVGLAAQLQIFGDGSIFHAVAAQEAWRSTGTISRVGCSVIYATFC